MKSIALSALVLALAATAQAGPNWLARVDGMTPEALTSLGVDVLMELDNWCLVRASDAALDRIGPGFELLDRSPEDRFYVLVTPARSFDRTALSAYGRVLTEDRHGLLLATTEERILELNRLPVALCRVPQEPMVIAGSGQQRPVLPVTADSSVQSLVDRVSADSIRGFIERQVAFYTRYSTTDSCRAAMAWVRDQFAGYNCDSTALEVFRSSYAPNAIGVKRGRVNPQRIYIICGHVDNTSDYAPNRCPGSDDNASGTAAVLEACRVFSDVEFDNTVWFIGFSGEEQGLYGSDSFAARCYRRRDSIQAVLNFDMISYGRQNRDTLEIIGKRTNPNCEWLVDYFIAQADTFAALKVRKSMVNSAPYSDHHSFWQRGYVAFCGIERDFTPMYHTIGDTIGPLYYTYCGTNNIPMATEAIKAAVASIAKLAGAHTTTGASEPERPARPGRIARVSPTVGSAPFIAEFASPGRPGARLEVYDAAGNLVRTLLRPFSLSAAPALVAWDGRDEAGRKCSPGIYLFRLLDGAAGSAAKAILAE